MIFRVKPVSKLKGTVELPSSKSYSIRAALIAGCGGKSLIKNYSDCDDAVVALNVIKALGSKIQGSKKDFRVIVPPKIKVPSKISVKESGTTLRFILPLLALYERPVQVVGEGTLVGRPNTFLVETLRRMGAQIQGSGPKQSVPIRLSGGQVKGGRISIDGSLSSQFISALLITAPKLSDHTILKLSGKELVSADYIEMTDIVLKKAGIRIKKINNREFSIKGSQKYKGLTFTIPSDYGLAAFLFAAASLVPSKIILRGHFNDALIQADGAILSFLKKMGVRLERSKDAIMIQGPFQLKGGTFSLKSCPDLVPIMAVLALFAKGKTRLVDIKHARAKESDRISDLRHELLKIGAHIKEGKGDLTIIPQSRYKKDVLLDPHKDHRLAMAFSILGLKVGVSIKDIECTAKSYPNFVKDIKTLVSIK